MPHQHFESLQAIMGERPLHAHRPHALLHVGKLWLVSTPTYHPDGFDLPYWMRSAVSEPHLDYLRERALAGVAPVPLLPKKIYLSRRGFRSRALRNERELETELRRAGFSRIRTEALGFLE
jgi:hypothetical protein